jgi:hypothetical protein
MLDLNPETDEVKGGEVESVSAQNIALPWTNDKLGFAYSLSFSATTMGEYV